MAQLAAAASRALAAARHAVLPPRAPSFGNGGGAMPALHHHAATRLFVGTLPLLSCAAALVARDAAAPRIDGLAAARFATFCCLLAAECAALVVLRRGGAAATARVACLAAAMHALPAAAVAHAALAAARRAPPCHDAQTSAECSLAAVAAAERAWTSFLLPLGAPLLALSGLPPRFAFSLEAARAALLIAFVVLHLNLALYSHPQAACAAVRLGIKAFAAAVVAPVALRCALGADEARELAQLRGLCPRVVRPALEALLAAGAAAQRVPGLDAATAAAMLAMLAAFCAKFGWHLYTLGHDDADVIDASPLRRGALVAAWGVAFAAAACACVALAARRAARHAVSPAAARAVHALHLRLSALDAAAPLDAALGAAADALLAALPRGCAVALAEWTTVNLPGATDAQPRPSTSFGSSSASPHSGGSVGSDDAKTPPAQRSIEVLRVAARGPRHGAAAAMRVAARRGSAPRGSAAAALAKPAAGAGLTLDSSDFAEGVHAFVDWAALVADARAGSGTVSLALLGSGSSVCGGLWVHAPAAAPAPAALRAYAEAVGAVLLRNAAHAAALHAAAAAARADADVTLVGFTAAVLEGAALAPRDAEYLRCSMSSANTLLAIIDQLLDYAKWGNADVAGGAVGGAALAHAPLRLCNVLDEVVGVLGGRAAAAGVRLVVEASARAARAAVRGDAPRLRQVVVNLVDNALKHTPRGGAVTLTADVRAAPRRGVARSSGGSDDDDDDELSCGSSSHKGTANDSSQSDDDARHLLLAPPARGASLDGADAAPLPPLPTWLRITVADTGTGIAPEEHWRLFRPFSQVPGGVAGAKPPGTGLGLVISRAIVRSMGGDVTFRSSPGVGTTFSVMAPFASDPDADPRGIDADDADALAGVALLPLLRDETLAGALIRTAAQWGAVPAATSSLPFAAYADFQAASAAETQSEEAARLRGCVAAAAGSGGPWRALLVLADARAAVALRGGGAPPLPPRAVCVLAAPAAEQAAWSALRAAPLDLPTSPGRLLAALRAAAAAAAAEDDASAVTPAAAAGVAQHASSEARLPPPSPPPSALRVLLAEDNPMNAAVARAVLARCGVASPRVVVDGAEAVAAFQEALPPNPPWSVLLLDMRMPHLSGPEAARAIRDIEAQHSPPLRRTHIVAVTANSSEEDRRECLAAGMDEFLVKPITPAVLRAMLARLTTAAAAA